VNAEAPAVQTVQNQELVTLMDRGYHNGGNAPNRVIRNQPSRTVIVNIQNNFGGYNRYWTSGWYDMHPRAWRPYGYYGIRWWHRPTWYNTCSWLAGFFAGVHAANTPRYYPYDYGTNIVYRRGVV
jgi:hypothetical protein